jgi:hypothetical protein
MICTHASQGTCRDAVSLFHAAEVVVQESPFLGYQPIDSCYAEARIGADYFSRESSESARTSEGIVEMVSAYAGRENSVSHARDI